MAVLILAARPGRVRMIEVLGVRLGIVDIAFGIVVPLIESAAAAQRLADDAVAGLGEDALAFADLAPRRDHALELGAAQAGEIDHDRRVPGHEAGARRPEAASALIARSVQLTSSTLTASSA